MTGRHPTPSRRTLSVATIAVALALSAAACGRRDQAQDSRSGPPPPAGAVTPADAPASSESATPLLRLLPEDLAVAGWSRARSPRRFGPGDLWEHIDGASESVIAFGFQELVTTGYRQAPSGLEVTIDIYKMQDVTAAFGLYAQETDPSAEVVSIGAEGSRRTTVLGFWAGAHYVKLTAFKDDPAMAPHLEALAREIASRIGDPGRRPPLLERFPARDLVARSQRVIPKDPLGQGYLPAAFEAEYRTGSASWKLVLIPFESAEAAKGGFDQYRTFVVSGGTLLRTLAAPGDGGFVAKDGYYGLLVAARSGPMAAIALGPPSEREGLSAVTALLR